jgi:hypothetical protein
MFVLKRRLMSVLDNPLAQSRRDSDDHDTHQPLPHGRRLLLLGAQMMTASRSELARLVRQVQDLTLELAVLEKQPGAESELEAKGRTLDQLRWRLASAARRAASNNLDTAA